MWTKTDDGSILDSDGKVIFFSNERFVSDICLGDCCFICGARPATKKFNDEHVVPEWLLRRYRLFDRTITLPNETKIKYAQYKVPCCEECNSLMGDTIEVPISRVIAGGADAIREFLAQGNLFKLFVWVGLIFLKMHLKDRAYRFHLDARKGEEKIADMYEWEELHHIHTIIRCFYTGSTIQPEAIGSFLTLPVNPQLTLERFDYGDLYFAQTMLLRLDDVAVVAVFNDSGGAMSYFWRRLQRITGPVSELQLREVMVELAYLNLHMKERPVFVTECDISAQECRVVARRPALELIDRDLRVRGQLLRYAFRGYRIEIPNVTQVQVNEAIDAGTLTLLFDDRGKFVTHEVANKPSSV